MKNIVVTKKDLIWSYSASIISLLTSASMLLFVYKNINSDELGLWYSFIGFNSFTTLLDFGFTNILNTNVTYAWSGVKDIKAKGYDVGEQNNEPNYKLLSETIIASKKICFVIGIICLLIMLSIGSLYILYITKTLSKSYIFDWVIFCIATFIGIAFCYWNNCLRSVGAIKNYQETLIASKICQLIVSIVGAYAGLGIQSLVFGVLIGNIISVLSSKELFLNFENIRNHFINKENINKTKEIFSKIWINSKKMGIVTLSTFFIRQSTTIICSIFIGLEETASYGLCLQVMNILVSIALIWFQSNSSSITNSIVSKDKEKSKMIISVSVIVFWIVMIVGLIGFIVVGIPILKILKPDVDIPVIMAVLLGIYTILENNHSLFASCIVFSNDVPFMKSSIISGICIVILSFIFINVYRSIYTLILIQMFVQLSYNNWKWPNYVLKKNNLTVREMFSYFNSYFKRYIKL